MLGKFAGLEDTIVALATPPGVGAIGVIRLSGSNAIPISNAIFASKDLTKAASHTVHVGWIRQGEEIIDEAVVTLFRKPRSYTGEDVVEISCHGSPYILDQVIQLCVQQGARMAKPGEFTQRAFLNGRLDLIQAESVADLIASHSAASHRTAMQHMRGGFSKKLKMLREQLIQFSALIELELDFSQEDVEFADRTQLHHLIDTATAEVQLLLDSFKMGNVIKTGVHTAIVGKPNAGKSTLLNVLLNENRAIVSEIAGTTRDTIEEVLNIEGILFRLIDTAGIREHTADVIESIGVERSLEKMRNADIVVYVFDVSEMDCAELHALCQEMEVAGKAYLLVGNKVDLIGEEQARKKFETLPDIVFIAAKNDQHTGLLKKRLIAEVLTGPAPSENTIITNARHHAALQEVIRSLLDIKQSLLQRIPGDLMALDIRRCLYYLGEITGEITTDDQLDYIFSKFCIGK